MEKVKGYKVFNPDWTCRNKQYTCPGVFEEDVIPFVCNSGMHFCKKAADCFNYYSFDPKNHVAEVIALAEYTVEDDYKCVTTHLEIVREVPWTELLEIVNTGKGCTGLRNSGNRNSGDLNSGNSNSGDWNSGDWNSGDWNSGHSNSGNSNSGHSNSGHSNSGHSNSGHSNSGSYNSGHSNSGSYNSGDLNSGNRNSGNRNSGNSNSGDWNSGNWNTGNRNSGHSNSGDWNSGNWNTGNWNSGDWNSGHWNSGDWNKCSFSNGCFNTAEPKIYLFNKPSDWTYGDWLNSNARYLLNQIPCDVLKYVWYNDMTDEEKAAHPEAETTGGYLKKCIVTPDDRQVWWNTLSDYNKSKIFAIPNFDAAIFKEITGIDIENGLV